MSWSRPSSRVRQWEGGPITPRVPAPVAVVVQSQRPIVAARRVEPMPKPQTYESEAWRRAVASLPCVLCNRPDDTQCAHRNEGKGMAQKTDDVLTAALCTRCHGEIDQGKDLTREERRERMDRAILLTLRELARRGLIGIVR